MHRDCNHGGFGSDGKHIKKQVICFEDSFLGVSSRVMQTVAKRIWGHFLASSFATSHIFAWTRCGLPTCRAEKKIRK